MRQGKARLILPLVMVASFLAAVPVAGQAVRRIELKAPTATHPEEFTTITSVRELSDGRAIVTDGREQRLVVLDFAAKTAAQIGQKGRGPNEYSNVAWVLPTAGDSSIMWDLSARRWLLFDGPRIVTTIPPDHPAILATGSVLSGADSRGRVMARIEPKRGDGVTETGLADSSAIVFVQRATGRADSVVRVRNAPRRIEIMRRADGEITSSSTRIQGTLVSEEQAVLFADGTLAIARIEPFRVDWRSPTGTWTRGVPLAVPVVRIDARERAAYIERNRANFDPKNFPPNFPAPKLPDAGDFPAMIPPFPLGSVTVGPAGSLLVRRTRSADITGNHYFVIDRSGRVLGEIALPLERTILGAGPNSIYIGVKDEDDILRIQRHPWP